MSPGRLIAVVGPSGVGKDSVMSGLVAAHPALGLVRRAITRDPDSGGEDSDPISPEIFDAHRSAGNFALSWGAHGLYYAIPRAALLPLSTGRDLLANLSRGVLAEARAVAPRLTVLHITASAATLASRLAHRGRETPADISTRLARAAPAFPDGIDVITVTNDGPLADTVATALAALYPDRAAR